MSEDPVASVDPEVSRVSRVSRVSKDSKGTLASDVPRRPRGIQGHPGVLGVLGVLGRGKAARATGRSLGILGRLLTSGRQVELRHPR